MRTSHVVPAVLLAGLATAAQAKTEVEMVFDLLQHQVTTTQEDYDSEKIDDKETDLRTVGSGAQLNVLSDGLIMHFGAYNGDDSGGTFALGFEVTPNLYVGGLLLLDNNKDTETTKPDGGTESEIKTESNTLGIGPFLEYRNKTNAQMISAVASLAQLNVKSKSETATTNTSEAKMMGLEIGGGYRKAVFERVYMGAGLSYMLSLSGDAEREVNDVSDDGDFDMNILTITLADMLVEF